MAYAVIREPGKFEGELEIVPKMWDVVMEGCACDVLIYDKVYSFVSLLAVDEPITNGLYGACLWERSDGFVMSEWFETEEEYKAAIERAERIASEED